MNTLWPLWLGAMILAITAPQAAAENGRIASPRIRALAQEMAKDKAAALEGFWQDVKGKCPLVEAIEGDNNNLLVTFLWRGDASVERIEVRGGPFATSRAILAAVGAVIYVAWCEISGTGNLPCGIGKNFSAGGNDPTSPSRAKRPSGAWSHTLPQILVQWEGVLSLSQTNSKLPLQPTPPIQSTATAELSCHNPTALEKARHLAGDASTSTVFGVRVHAFITVTEWH